MIEIPMILDPHNYSIANRSQQTFAFRTLCTNFHFLTKFKDPTIILDLGCGPGNVTKLMTTSLPNVHMTFGLDPDNTMLEIAKLRYADPRIIYKRASAELIAKWPEEILKSKVDIVSIFAAMQFFVDAQTAMINVQKVLKPGGILIGYTFAKPFPAIAAVQHYLNCESLFMRWYQDEKFFGRPILPQGIWVGADSVEQKFEQMLVSAKLRPLKVALFSANFNFGPGELKDFVLVFIQKHVDTIPEELQTKFIAECCKVFERTSNCETHVAYGTESSVSSVDNLLLEFVAENPTTQ